MRSFLAHRALHQAKEWVRWSHEGVELYPEELVVREFADERLRGMLRDLIRLIVIVLAVITALFVYKMIMYSTISLSGRVLLLFSIYPMLIFTLAYFVILERSLRGARRITTLTRGSLQIRVVRGHDGEVVDDAAEATVAPLREPIFFDAYFARRSKHDPKEFGKQHPRFLLIEAGGFTVALPRAPETYEWCRAMGFSTTEDREEVERWEEATGQEGIDAVAKRFAPVAGEQAI